MRYFTNMTLKMTLTGMVLAGTVLVTGCNNSGNTTEPGKSSTGAATHHEDSSGGGAEATPIEAPEPAKPTMPVVKLTEMLNKTCRVKVGDMMPEATLAKLDGQAVSIRNLAAGNKLTVICFWKADRRYSLEELKQLNTYIVGPYASKGVQVVAINEDDPVATASKAFHESGGNYPCLLDPEGAYFIKIATEKLPRTYLLDSTGKVLWFDIDYSLGTLRDLERAIQFTLESGQ